MILMNIDYLPSNATEPHVRKYRVLGGDWGKVRLSCGARKRSWSEDPKTEGLHQVKVRPCCVRLKKCPITSHVDLVWDIEKNVDLDNKTDEIIYSSVVIRECDADYVEVDYVEVKTEIESKKKKSSGMLGMSPSLKPAAAESHSCPKCGKMLKSMYFYRSHLLSHYQVFQKMLPITKPYTCPICFKSLNRKHQQIYHYAFGHDKVFELTGLTRETLKLSNNIDNNVGCDEDGRFSCPKCDFKFIGRSRVQYHILTHYHDVFTDVLPHKKPFICPVCDKEFVNDKRGLIRHYAFIHRRVFQLTDTTPADWFMDRVENNDEVNEAEEARLNELLSPSPPPGGLGREMNMLSESNANL